MNEMQRGRVLPITPSCCGDNGVPWIIPAPKDPDARDKRSDSATTEPPGLCERADIFDPLSDIKSAMFKWTIFLFSRQNLIKAGKIEKKIVF